MKYTTTLAVVLLFAFALSCTQKIEPTTEGSVEKTTSNTEEANMYKASELAQLMRDMYDSNMEMKKQIMEGNLPESFPEDFAKIHSAIATDPTVKTDAFHGMADYFVENMKAIEAADSVQIISSFNTMVNTCVSCHQMYCKGPIPKIKKLYIPEV